MIIRPEPRRSLWDFTKSEFSFLNLAVDPNDILWHYTSGASLISIVESHELYATHVACLNDRTEVRYGEVLLRDSFAKMRARPGDGVENWLIDRMAAIAQDDVQREVIPQVLPYGSLTGLGISALKDVWVTCFSAEKDDLSQWRAYGGGENGYAIGFAAEGISDADAQLIRVNYSRQDHEKAAMVVGEKLLDCLLEFARQIDLDLGDPDLTQQMEGFLEEQLQDATGLAPMLKDPAFKNERECRLVCESYGWGERNLRFQQRQTLMSAHLPKRFTDKHNAGHLPIREVVIGPCRHPGVSRMSVNELLWKNGYHGVRVSMSDVPFQLT